MRKLQPLTVATCAEAVQAAIQKCERALEAPFLPPPDDETMVAYVECILAPGIAAGERSGECDDFRMWARDLKNPYLQQQSIVGLNYSRCAQLSGHPEADLQSLYDMVAVYLRPGTSDAAAFKQVCFPDAADTCTLRCILCAPRLHRRAKCLLHSSVACLIPSQAVLL